MTPRPTVFDASPLYIADLDVARSIKNLFGDREVSEMNQSSDLPDELTYL